MAKLLWGMPCAEIDILESSLSERFTKFLGMNLGMRKFHIQKYTGMKGGCTFTTEKIFRRRKMGKGDVSFLGNSFPKIRYPDRLQ